MSAQEDTQEKKVEFPEGFPEGFPKFEVKKKHEKTFKSTKGDVWKVVWDRVNYDWEEYDQKEFDEYYDKYGDAYDIYEQEIHDVNFYKNGEWKYMLKENDYRTDGRDNPFVEYFEMDNGQNEPQIVHTFNDEYGYLALYNAETGEIIHATTATSLFFEEYEMFPGDLCDREYMYIGGWVWTPFPAKMIIHIPTFLKTPKYKPINIHCWEEYENNGRRGKISLHGCSTVAEFLQKKDDMEHKFYVEKSTKIWNANNVYKKEDTLLRRFFENKNGNNVEYVGDARETFRQLLETEQDGIYVRSFRVESNNVLQHVLREYDYRIIRPTNEDRWGKSYDIPHDESLSIAAPKVFMEHFGDLRNLPWSSFHTRFEIRKMYEGKYEKDQDNDHILLTIIYKQDLTPHIFEDQSVKDCQRYYVDKEKPCSIVVA